MALAYEILVTRTFQARAVFTPPRLNLLFTGAITEDVNLSKVVTSLKDLCPEEARTLAIDVEGVTRINSCGIREWILFLERLQPLGREVRFSILGEVFAELAGFTPAVLGRVCCAIERVVVPYLCDGCGSRVTSALLVEDLVRAAEVPTIEPLPCPQCKKPMHADILENEYFEFLRHLSLTGGRAG